MNWNRWKQYVYLARLNKPIGIFLLLWPTMWALWLASGGRPTVSIVCLFILGVIVMRSAGCVLNDIADRHVDKKVERTRERPLTSGKVSLRGAVVLLSILGLLAFVLVLFLNKLTLVLAIIGAVVTAIYPYMKRFTHLPQLGLGIAFSWGVPMAFAAQTGKVPLVAWELFLTAAVWPVIYDTMYAISDRNDDIKIGIKSTAILFGKKDKWIIGLLQMLFLFLLLEMGRIFHLNEYYYASLEIVALLMVYQQSLVQRGYSFKAFINNHWVGLVVFVGILLGIK